MDVVEVIVRRLFLDSRTPARLIYLVLLLEGAGLGRLEAGQRFHR